MVENINKVSNPLTIIAIFAALSEVAGTVALGLVDKMLQPVFIWFVMLFPVLLVVVFFLILIYKSSVFYAPSDFRDDKSYLELIQTKPYLKVISENVKSVEDSAKELDSKSITEIFSKMDLRILRFLSQLVNKSISMEEQTKLLLKEFNITQEAEFKLLHEGVVTGVTVSLNNILIVRSSPNPDYDIFQMSEKVYSSLTKHIEERTKK